MEIRKKPKIHKPEMKQETIHWVIFHSNYKFIELNEHH